MPSIGLEWIPVVFKWNPYPCRFNMRAAAVHQSISRNFRLNISLNHISHCDFPPFKYDCQICSVIWRLHLILLIYTSKNLRSYLRSLFMESYEDFYVGQGGKLEKVKHMTIYIFGLKWSTVHKLFSPDLASQHCFFDDPLNQIVSAIKWFYFNFKKLPMHSQYKCFRFCVYDDRSSLARLYTTWCRRETPIQFIGNFGNIIKYIGFLQYGPVTPNNLLNAAGRWSFIFRYERVSSRSTG